jgi:serine/threonine protein phosphatase PrpC
MEDAHTVALHLEDDGKDKQNSFFAVYDGHGGTLALLILGESVADATLKAALLQSSQGNVFTRYSLKKRRIDPSSGRRR